MEAEAIVVNKNNEPKKLIRTKFPGVLVVEVSRTRGRYLWFSTDQRFDATGSGWISTERYKIPSTGGYLSEGYYRDNMPGEWCPEGWDFALKLYSALSQIEGLEFKVSSPRKWGVIGFTVDLSFKPKWLHSAVIKEFGFIQGSIPARLWGEDLISGIVDFIRNQQLGCLDCGKGIHSELTELNVRYCLGCVFAKFGFKVPEFHSGLYRYDDPELKRWTFVIPHGFTNYYHLYRGDPDACRLLAAIKQEPYDVEILCRIDFCGYGGNEVKVERERIKISHELGSRLVFIPTEEALKEGSFYLGFCPNPYYHNRWVVARLQDLSEEKIFLLESSRQEEKDCFF